MPQNYTIVNGELYHYGVKGMKWGQRRAQKKAERKERKAYKKRERAIAKNWYKAYNRAAAEAERTIIPALNEKYKGYNFRDSATNAKIKKAYDRYIDEYAESWNKLYETKVSELFGDNPRGTQAKDLAGYYTQDAIDAWKNS